MPAKLIGNLGNWNWETTTLGGRLELVVIESRRSKYDYDLTHVTINGV
jgi:hypothetical protein